MSKAKKQKPVIFVVESSKVISKLICAQLNECGYETEIFTDAMKLLTRLVKESPQCIIADKNLPYLDGMQLCKILKDGSAKSSVPFILISIDEEVFDFWSSASGANKVISVSDSDFSPLIQAVQSVLAYDYIETGSFYEKTDETLPGKNTEFSSEEEVMNWVVNAMEKGNFYLNMANNVLNLYSFVKDTDALVNQIFSMLYQICKYDAISLIIDSHPTKNYRAVSDQVSEQIEQEYLNICRTEYEQQAKKNYTITYEEKTVDCVLNVNSAKKSADKFSTYHSFVIKNDEEFVGILFMASFQKKLFSYKVQSSIEFALPYLAVLLQESVVHEKLFYDGQKMRTAFERFVPSQIIDDLLLAGTEEKQPEIIEKRKVVILMSDIRNFTSISEMNQPEDVVNFLNTYFTHMGNIVTKYGGTVDKFIGDAIMVLFGAPISYNDNAQRAVRAAIEMYSTLEQVPVGQIKFPEGMKLDIGIGIHYGDVIVGNIGSEDRTGYDVIGDTVNLASRLEGLTKLYGAKVIVSQSVKDELPEDMNLMLLDSVKVKGKTASVKIYRADEKPLPEEFTRLYQSGLKSYTEGAFSLALPYFEKALEILPNDKAAKLLTDRCNEFMIKKPEKWDGAIALTSK